MLSPMTAPARQTSLFDDVPALFDTGPQVLVEDAEGGVVHHPGLVDHATAMRWFEALRDEVPWQAQRRPMYDRVVDVPRLTASFRLASPGLPSALQEALERVQARCPEPFNGVGLNYYRDGNDSVAMHNDKLHILVPHHPIALLSLGGTRRMTIRSKRTPRTTLHVDLESGSLLVMSYDSQLHWEHGIPKTRADVAPRISLAFRVRPDVDGPRRRQ